MIERQIAWSRAFDRLLPANMVRGGKIMFKQDLVAPLVTPGMKVMDVGSGRFPFYTPEDKRRLQLHVTGLDLNPGELAAAPAGSYDDTVEADIMGFEGSGDKDLVICMSVLEHIADTGAALRSLATIVSPGGTVAIFVPSRNALFARLNLLLPQSVTRWLLKYKPAARGGDGWKAYYNRCTPRDFEAMAREAGLEPVRTEVSYSSKYFQVLAPVYVLWRLWILGFKAIKGRQAAETFCMELRRPLAREADTLQFASPERPLDVAVGQ
jgi:2-polyprenyl-6-hydroxyphenyl methylase/3-demethylubiquinone-9 3-methyltransferase